MEFKETEYRHYRVARVANSLAFIAFATTLFNTVILPYIFAPVSIILAILSKGKTKSKPIYAKLAIGLSCFALVLNTFICGFGIYNLTHDTKTRRELNSVFEQMYGMSMEEYMNNYMKALESPDSSVFFQNGN